MASNRRYNLREALELVQEDGSDIEEELEEDDGWLSAGNNT